MPDILPNIDRLEAVYDHILADPEHHNQAHYSLITPCDSSHCFAGWAVVLFGEPHYRVDETGFRKSNGEKIHPAAAAAEVLGLSLGNMIGGTRLVEGVGKIFGSNTSLEMIRWWIDHFRAEVGLPPREFRTDRNIDLMEEVWDQICERPELYDQEVYGRSTACGTSYCFAGWTVVLGGGWMYRHGFLNSSGTPISDLEELEDAAYTLLGITSDDAWGPGGVFSGRTSAAVIRRRIDQFRVEAGLPARTDAPIYVSG